MANTEPGFEWNVQPYRWLYQMRNQYTQMVVLAGRKKAYQQAREAQEWMKRNAPWTDRTEEQRERQNAPYPPGARAGLRVNVVGEDGVLQAFNEGMKKMQKLDDKTFRSAVAAREKAVKPYAERLEKAFKLKQITKETRVEGYRRINERYPEVRRPSGRNTAAATFEREWKSEHLPIVEIRFSHHPSVTYAIWLEVARGGRYGIISRAMDVWGKKFLNEFKRIANLKQYRERLAFGPEISPQQQYDAIAAEESRKKGRPYEPFTPEKKARRRYRRFQYDPDEYQRRKEQAWADLAREDALAAKYRAEELEAARAKRRTEAPATMKIGTINSRSARR